MYWLVLVKYLLKGRNLSKPILNRYKPILNQYLTDTTDSL